MGSRDDNLLDDGRADTLMRRLLARADEPSQATPPPDIVARMMRRLPSGPPARAARRRAVRLAFGAILLGAVALVALVGLANMLGGGPDLAMLFGDGGGGLSRVLLTLHLLAKPIVRAVGMVGMPLLLVGALTLVVGAWGWRWLLRSEPSYAYVENRS